MDNTGDFGTLLVVQAFAGAICVAVVEGAKQTGLTTARWAMPFACLVGIGLSALTAATDLVEGFDLKSDLALVILGGIIVGLVSSGLFSGVRRVVGAS